MIDPSRLEAAYNQARGDLLAERDPAGHWIGQLSASALSTATALSALAIVERHAPIGADGWIADEIGGRKLSEQIMRSLRWLVGRQNVDGGWGDTDKSHSNIATTMLVRAAFSLNCLPSRHAEVLDRAENYVTTHGGVAGLRRRYGRDKTFAAPILANCALAGLVDWRQVASLPFELACVPQRYYRRLRLPVVSYAIPALVAIGQAKFFHRKPLNPITRILRRATVDRSLAVLEQMQPESGGFLEAIPLTSFVVMSLASTGRFDHPVCQRGVRFLLDTVRADGSWPIDANLATWNTTLAIGALGDDAIGDDNADALVDWLLKCQMIEEHPFTGAAPGGWGWSDLSGAVPDVDDTSGALLALAVLRKHVDAERRERIDLAARGGLQWIVDLQNRDGGWPTFCRGWGTMPFDRSGADLSAHALRAMHAWKRLPPVALADDSEIAGGLKAKIAAATRGGLQYLASSQRPDGSFVPLWFGNQDHPDDENPVFGTARVLLAYRDLDLTESPAARRAFDYLRQIQNVDGGFGGTGLSGQIGRRGVLSSVEETGAAVEALLAAPPDRSTQSVVAKGLKWLAEAGESGRHRDSSPIGFYFAKLWYYERLYPLLFSASALRRAASQGAERAKQKTAPLGRRGV
jgi:squalene-hopene/tetraprenyl-beta-curcumene cyclase